jgi:hypothetical protein
MILVRVPMNRRQTAVSLLLSRVLGEFRGRAPAKTNRAAAVRETPRSTRWRCHGETDRITETICDRPADFLE